MVYWISLIPGAMAGFALTWITATIIKHEKIKFGEYNVNEARIYAGIMFIVSTILFGPFCLYMYSHYFVKEGAEFSLTYALSITIAVLTGVICTIPKHKEYWKSYLFMSFLFVFAIAWILPLLYDYIAV